MYFFYIYTHNINMKKIKILNAFLLFGLSFLAHFMYKWFPCFITSVFFPVNESVWEHMKIIFTCSLIIGLIEYFILKIKHIEYENIIINTPIISILGITVYLVLYYSITSFIKESMLLNIALLLIVYIIMQLISYYILSSEHIKYEKAIGISITISCILLFGYLTYYPIKDKLFLDTEKNAYGIIKEE